MTRLPLPFLAVFCLLIAAYSISAQSSVGTQASEPKNNVAAKDTTARSKPAKDAEVERILKERRLQAQSLLISLAADAGNFNDQTLRARTQARIADALWDADSVRARTLFRKAWDAAEEADKEGQRKLQEEIHQQEAKLGESSMLLGRSSLRSEVLRLAARRDRVLGEEFLAKLKVEKQQEATDGNDRNRRNPFDPPRP